MADIQTDGWLTRERLKEQILRLLPELGRFPTAIPGLTLSRREDVDEIHNMFYTPVVGVIVQGSKCAIVGEEEYRYGAGYCCIVGVDMPIVNYVTFASPEEPFLSAALSLDRQMVAQLAMETAAPCPKEFCSPKAMSVAKAESKLMDALLRLVELLDEPKAIPVMAPLIIREIHYRLLTGPQGGWLRSVCAMGTKTNQIARAISLLREKYNKPLRVETLADTANMAPSTFHRHFREVTNLSPLQFQKLLRLHEAQRLMLIDRYDVISASHTVGYESATQFIREYKRQFGEPPRRNVNRLKKFAVGFYAESPIPTATSFMARSAASLTNSDPRSIHS
ncbi:MAG: AraC family transcriptional regulator [Desulfovibrio sp.]|nr:AraC family transcriptional regulator [Desulfovibrio sp.]